MLKPNGITVAVACRKLDGMSEEWHCLAIVHSIAGMIAIRHAFQERVFNTNGGKLEFRYWIARG